MKKHLINTIELENNLTLNLYDESVKMIGDRWLVTLVARMEIPVDWALVEENDFSLKEKNEIRKTLGKNVVYEQKSNRIFVNLSDKENVLQELHDTFIENTLHYLAHENFSQQFLLKKIKETVDKKQQKR